MSSAPQSASPSLGASTTRTEVNDAARPNQSSTQQAFRDENARVISTLGYDAEMACLKRIGKAQ